MSLSRNFINHELYEIQNHYRELLNDRKLIKSNTASHYSNFISKMFTKVVALNTYCVHLSPEEINWNGINNEELFTMKEHKRNTI